MIPQLTKQEKSDGIDKSVYCSGEPIEVEENEEESECHAAPEDGAAKDPTGDVSSETLPNGICAVSHSKLPNAANIDNDVSEDEVCNVEIKNSKRHRRRRKALSSIN